MLITFCSCEREPFDKFEQEGTVLDVIVVGHEISLIKNQYYLLEGLRYYENDLRSLEDIKLYLNFSIQIFYQGNCIQYIQIISLYYFFFMAKHVLSST